MEKISWTDHVKNEVLQRFKEERNILHAINRRKANWFGRMLCRNYLLKHIVEEGRGKDRSDGKTRRKT
jgi:hypothetical protein